MPAKKPHPERRFAFTEVRLAALKAPAKGRAWFHDAKLPGLCVRMTAKGAASYYLYKWAGGRARQVRLGNVGEISLDQARTAAATMLGSVAAGGDPEAARRERREEPTFEELHAHWMETHAKPRKRSWREDERQYNVFLKPWALRRLSTIRKGDVQELHARIGRENGLYAANRVLALLRAMFNKRDELGCAGDNPAAGVKPFTEQSRDRFLQAHELHAFFAALARELPLFVDFFTLALLTGARRSNLQAMRWEEIDFQAAFWRIPDTKSGKPVVVPLIPAALEILTRRFQYRDTPGPWVFPGHRHGTHLKEPKSAWKRILARAGLKDLRPHDLRRSLGSWMVATGASLPIVGKTLGHSQPSATMVYSRLQLDPLRGAVQKAADAMLALGNGTSPETGEENGSIEGDGI